MEVQIHAAEHCNLNCRGCDAFAPLMSKIFPDIETIRRDLRRFSELTNGTIGTITISGGEPSQNPMLPEILFEARACFPNRELKIITNGILLEEAADEFWTACKINKVIISITLYPIGLNIDRIVDIAAAHTVGLVFQDDTDIRPKTLYSTPLNPSGTQSKKENYKLCFMANKNFVLENGKIYTCPTIAHIERVNKTFNQNFEVSYNDYVDIYKIGSFDEISQFMHKPMPFCRYCNKKKRISGLKWKTSNMEMSEWICTE